MQSVKRDLYFGVAICILVFTCALAWGSPFVGTGLGSMPASVQDQMKQEHKSATYTGTVVKDGEQYALRDAAGQVYKLDDAERARPFEGKAVKVTGQLDVEAKLIHVESIEGTDA
jgi:hypothetical protein